MQELMAAIESLKPTLIGAILRVADFNSLPCHIRSRMRNDPYFHCFQVCIFGATLEAKYSDDPAEKVTLTFADSDFAGHALGLWRAMKAFPGNERVGSYAVASPREETPLQAADLLAYEMNLEFKRSLGIDRTQKRPKTRWPMTQFLRISGLPGPMIRYLTRAELLASYPDAPPGSEPNHDAKDKTGP